MDFESLKKYHATGLEAVIALETAQKELSKMQQVTGEARKELDGMAAKVATQNRILEGNAAKILEQDRDISKGLGKLTEINNELRLRTEEKERLEEGISELKRKINA